MRMNGIDAQTLLVGAATRLLGDGKAGFPTACGPGEFAGCSGSGSVADSDGNGCDDLDGDGQLDTAGGRSDAPDAVNVGSTPTTGARQ